MQRFKPQTRLVIVEIVLIFLVVLLITFLLGILM